MRSPRWAIDEAGEIRTRYRIALFYLLFAGLFWAVLFAPGLALGRIPDSRMFEAWMTVCLGPLPMFRTMSSADTAAEFLFYGLGGSSLWGIVVFGLAVCFKEKRRFTIALRQTVYAFTLWWFGIGFFILALSV